MTSVGIELHSYPVVYPQEVSISIWLQFSDDTASLLSSFGDLPYFLRLSSLAETVVVVTPGPSQRVFAQGDGGGPLLRAELLVSTCADQPITSNSISEGREWMDAGEGGTKRLARGSGWIRVNLDLGFLPKIEEGGEFEFDISDTLVESDSDIYVSNFDDESGNSSNDYYSKQSGSMTNRNWNDMGNGGMVRRNNLERAVLMPSQEEGAVYFSPSQENKGERKELEEVEVLGAQELEVGVGAVLSLLCLFAVLFLANCLPCALRDRRRTTKGEERDVELEEGTKEEEADERKETEGEDKQQEQQHGDIEEDVKEVEIIC